ncbi:MAG TPA: SDR family NAD(P)-dependent oxidoreductase [Pseudonocardiaceae bacterium]|nr:SDR family NAD(P)-dependent oxidoreductase [Pseudonocardiaceae bacterium]
MTDHIVLITGTSSGIGLAAAVAAAQTGWRVVATMRDTGRAKALLDASSAAGVTERIDVRPLDVTDRASVDACVSTVIAHYGRLDALINNAGAGHVGTLEQESIDEIRAVMEVNFFGVVQVTKAALPHLRVSRGRVLTVSSVGGAIGQPFNEAYCAAKFAVEGFMEGLAPVAATVGVGVAVIEPGAVASEFVSNVGFDRARIDAMGPYAPALRSYVERTGSAFVGAQTPAQAAAPIVDALTADPLVFRVQTSEAARQFVGAKYADVDGSVVQALTAGWVS